MTDEASQDSDVDSAQCFKDGDLVIGLAGAIGTPLTEVGDIIAERLKVSSYHVHRIRISDDVIPAAENLKESYPSAYERTSALMDAGNAVRQRTGDNSFLALGAISKIYDIRHKLLQKKSSFPLRNAFIVQSLKHPEEVDRFRETYPLGFYLVGVHTDKERQINHLCDDKRMTYEQAVELIERDKSEHLDYGQSLIETFHLSDFFLKVSGHSDQLKKSIWRILAILFGDPYRTPTFNEYAMFLAFAASLRSADLSRQVGAVIARQKEILATGANDCPSAGGGLYWPYFNKTSRDIEDVQEGRDYIRGCDANKQEQKKILDDILNAGEEVGIEREKLEKVLEGSYIHDLTEFGRVVHAEMEALLCCARNMISARGATLYCTTFPCHNCAKHIIAAGVEKVIYIEPYPKSKAEQLHGDAIRHSFGDDDGEEPNKIVRFEPFVGVGPRRFFDLFSMRLGSGRKIRRKDSSGKILKWTPETATPRLTMLPHSYLEAEQGFAEIFNQQLQTEEPSDG